MEHGPQASHLVLLRQLPTLATGTKVRFLGCVEGYDGRTAILVLKERFPSSSKHITACVDVKNITDSLDVKLTQVGAWINVVGYYKEPIAVIDGKTRTDTDKSVATSVKVDAVLIWSAGAVKLDDYEAGVKAMQATTVRSR